MAPLRFIDTRLVDRIGAVSDDAVVAIDAEVDAALMQVVGHLLDSDIAVSVVAPILAPWAFDLARGLHWHDRRGSATTTADLTSAIAPDIVPAAAADEIVREVDVAWRLVDRRYAAQIFGPDAARQPSTRLRTHCPWFDAAVLGFRIDLVLEATFQAEAER